MTCLVQPLDTRRTYCRQTPPPAAAARPPRQDRLQWRHHGRRRIVSAGRGDVNCCRLLSDQSGKLEILTTVIRRAGYPANDREKAIHFFVGNSLNSRRPDCGFCTLIPGAVFPRSSMANLLYFVHNNKLCTSFKCRCCYRIHLFKIQVVLINCLKYSSCLLCSIFVFCGVQQLSPDSYTEKIFFLCRGIALES